MEGNPPPCNQGRIQVFILGNPQIQYATIRTAGFSRISSQALERLAYTHMCTDTLLRTPVQCAFG